MKIQPVKYCIQILRMFSSENQESGLGVNEIFRKTGWRDKKKATDNISYLVRAKLLETKKLGKRTKRGKKEPKILTSLGKEFLDFINDIEYYNQVCTSLRDKINNINSQILEAVRDGKERMETLKRLQWTNEMIESGNNTFESLIFTKSLASPEKIITVTHSRYVAMLSKLSLNNNYLAKDILTQLVTDVVSTQFSVMTHNRDLDIESFYSNLILDDWNWLIGVLSKTGQLRYPKIYNELKDFAIGTLRVLAPSNEMKEKMIVLMKESELGLKEHGFEDQIIKDVKETISIHKEAYNRK
jgi:hypothetical protein